MGRRENRLCTLLSWIHSVLLAEGLYVLAAGFLNLKEVQAALFKGKGFLLFLPVIFSFFCMRKIRNLWLYLLIAAAGSWFMWKLSGSLLTGILALAIFLIRSYVRVKKGKIKKLMQEMPGEAGAGIQPEVWEIPTLLDEPRPSHWAIFVVYYFVALAAGKHGCLREIFWLLAAEILVCFAFCFVKRQQDFIKRNRRLANLPAKTMMRVGRTVFALLAAALLLFMVPAMLYDDEPLTWINLPAMEIPVEETQESQTWQAGDMTEALEAMGLDGRQNQPPAWLETASKAFMAAILLIAAWLGCKALLRTLGNARESFSLEDEDEIISLDDAREDKEKLPFGGTLGRYMSPNMRIRRKYKKAILKGLKQPPQGTETPAQLEEKAGLCPGTPAVHELYEKARYSKAGCTKEEAGNYMGKLRDI